MADHEKKINNNNNKGIKKKNYVLCRVLQKKKLYTLHKKKI